MIRFAEQRDLPAIYSLWETCFPDEGGFNGYFFSHLYEPQHTLLLMQENTLCAMLQMLPYTLSVNGEPREITYIYGVCTHPAHRRRGYAAELLERSFALAISLLSIKERRERLRYSFRQKNGCSSFIVRLAIPRHSISRAAH